VRLPPGSQATRAADLPAVLAGREFDAVVDTCGFMPDVVERSTDPLRDAVGRYCFISIGVGLRE